MKSRDFVYWLQGFFEISETDSLDKKQVEIIKKHLNLVFAHEIDPEAGSQKNQKKLNDIHGGDKLIRC